MKRRYYLLMLAAFLGGCKDKAAEMMRVELVKIEIDPAPEFPDASCTPMRVRNENAMKTRVYITERFWQTGPGCNTGVKPRPLDPFDLAGHQKPGSYRYLGCAKKTWQGSFCTDYKSWTVTKVERVN